MDETEFTMNGQAHRLTRAAVLKAMRGQIPGRIQTYAVDVEGVRFPVKQVLAQSFASQSRRSFQPEPRTSSPSWISK